MEKTILLKKILMKCLICDMLHEVEEKEFETGEMTNQNLLNARNAYRIKMDLGKERVGKIRNPGYNHSIDRILIIF